MLAQRVITAVVLLLVLGGVVATQSAVVFGLSALVVVIAAAWEWERLGGKPSPQALWLVLGAVIPMTFFWVWRATVVLIPPEVVWALCGAAALVWCFCVPYFLRGGRPVRDRAVVFGVIAALALIGAWAGAVSLYQKDPKILLLCVAIPIIADTAAYFVGRRFGRRKLAPQVSPGKTVEGAIGGLTAVGFTHSAWVIWQGWAPWWILIFIALAGFSIVGDLFESLLKRQAGVKDSSNLLPGHGGVLDRIDAQLPVLPLAALAFSGIALR